MSIYRATTPTLAFEFPFDIADIDSLNLSFSQNKRTFLVLNKDDVLFDTESNIISVTLTQEQTSEFLPDVPLEMQFRIKIDNTVMASQIVKTDASRVLETEAL